MAADRDSPDRPGQLGDRQWRQVTGSIEGNVVTRQQHDRRQSELPLTGYHGGSAYAGTHSYWALAPAGHEHLHGAGSVARAADHAGGRDAADRARRRRTAATCPIRRRRRSSRHRAALPPSRLPPITYFAVQAAPKTVKVSHGKVTVSLNCKASKGRTVKGKTCAGTFTLTVAGHKVGHSFRFKSGKVSRITVKLPKRSMSAVTAAAHHKPKARKTAGKLVITTKLTAQVLSQRQGDAHDQGLTRTRRAHSSDRVRPPTR